MNGKKGLSRIMSALLAASSMIGGASAGKKVGKRRPIWKNPKLYYWGIPAFVVPVGVGIGCGVYRHRRKNKMKVKKIKEEVNSPKDIKKENFIENIKEELNSQEDIEQLAKLAKLNKQVEYHDAIVEKLSNEVIGIEEKYSESLKGEQWKEYLEFDAVGGVFDYDQYAFGNQREEYVRSLKDNEDGTRRFDVCRLPLTVDEYGAFRNLYIFRFECNEEDDKKVGYSFLNCKGDNYKNKTKYLSVRLGFGDVGDCFVRYDSEKPIESYAHAISNAVFFCELQKKFNIGYYGFTSKYDVFDEVLYEGVDYVKKYSSKIETKYGVKYENVKDDIDELYANCKILEEYYCEMLKAREKVLVEQGEK